MKIIVVNDHAHVAGGAAKIAIMTARGFAERGHDVEFFGGVAPVALELESMPGLKVTCLNEKAHTRDENRLRGAIRGLWYRGAAKAMREMLSRCDPKDTIVHFHAYRETLTTSVADVAHKMGFVTVYTAHEYTMGCPYGGFFDYRRNAICPLTGLSAACFKTKCNTSSYWNKVWYYLAEFVYSKISRIPSKLSHVVFISKLNQSVLIPYLGKKARYTIVSNAFDFASAEAAVIDDDSPFLFLGGLEPHKDPLTAARAARKLGAPIVFVGSGSLEAEIKRENPDAVVTGWLGREEVQAHLLRSRALVLPSIWYEAQPGTTMEAAACGVPIIVSNLCAGVEQVDELGVGAVFKGGDVDDLAAKMAPYLDTEFARKQGAAIQASYRSKDRSMDWHIARLLEIYRLELARQ
jgi:glycosyltransferase involved in cell wall biosynthesis